MKHYQMSESIPVGLLLAVSGGMLNAYTYLNRGQVFATMETGNMILLGINLSRGRLDLVLHYLLPILAFAAGILVTELIRRRLGPSASRLHWRQPLLLTECLVLVLVSLLPLGALDPLSNALVSFIAAIQVESFRSIHGNACATTMCTGNLRSGTEHLFRALASPNHSQSGRKSLFYYGLIGCFITGVVISSFLSPRFGGRTVLAACLPMLAAFGLMFRKPDPA